MLIPNHPHDERLSALASGDPDAGADASLTDHVASCARCTESVAELGALRASLAELPDLRPHRPLQLLPHVADAPASRVDALGGRARRFFAPMLTAGAALAIVGLVGTAGPLIGGAQSGGAALDMFQDVGERLSGGADSGAEAGEGPAVMDTGPEVAPSGEAHGVTEPQASDGAANRDEDSDHLAFEQQQQLTEERPIWPMVLFAGVAIMIAAVLLRWILAPRAG